MAVVLHFKLPYSLLLFWTFSCGSNTWNCFLTQLWIIVSLSMFLKTSKLSWIWKLFWIFFFIWKHSITCKICIFWNKSSSPKKWRHESAASQLQWTANPMMNLEPEQSNTMKGFYRNCWFIFKISGEFQKEGLV